jgi:hypothetical protein
MHKVTPQRLQLKMTTGSKKERANTSCVSTTITLNLGTMNLIILRDADNIPQRESPQRSLMCAGAVILMACSSALIQLRRLINTRHGNFVNDSNELLPTQSTIHKTVSTLSLTINYLTHSNNPKNSKYRGDGIVPCAVFKRCSCTVT